MALVIDRATILEWPQIESLRRANAGALPVDRIGRHCVAWWIVREGERVLGCYSFVDFVALGWRVVPDLCTAEGGVGADALRAMLEHVQSEATADRLKPYLLVDPPGVPAREAHA